MSRIIIISYLVALISIANTLSAQVQLCGVTVSDQNQWMPLYHKELRNKSKHISRSNDKISVPITVHLVARDNGVGRVKVQTALEVLCQLNDLYVSSNIEFHLSQTGISFIDHDGIFNNSDFTINKLKMQSFKSTNAINVFVVNKITGNNVVAYYDYENDWIVMQKNAFMANNKTLAHEIGHFFSLLHPHFGWDTQAWDPSVHVSPVAEISPDGVTPTELANGDNCSVAGDKLCDTASDYNFGIFWQGACDYGELVYDAIGEVVDPDESLIMSYFSDDCRGRFSAEQISIMHENINDASRAYLDIIVNEPIDTITNDVVQLSPSGSISLVADSLLFEWTEPNSSEHYYIEYDRSPTFSLDPKGVRTDTNFAWITNNWLLNTTYYWRVLTWNDGYFCHKNNGFEQFSLDVSALESNDKHQDIQLRFADGTCTMSYTIEEDKDIILSVFKIDGQKLFQQNVRLIKEGHVKSINGFAMNKGLFFISLNEKGKIIQSSIVSNL